MTLATDGTPRTSLRAWGDDRCAAVEDWVEPADDDDVYESDHHVAVWREYLEAVIPSLWLHLAPGEAGDVILNAVGKSTWILALQPGWDAEDGQVVNRETWERATRLLLRHAEWIRRRTGTPMKPPKILPGPDGGIDLDWNRETFYLLVHIPADPNKPASYYGNDRKLTSNEGTFDPHAICEPLLLWLANLR